MSVLLAYCFSPVQVYGADALETAESVHASADKNDSAYSGLSAGERDDLVDQLVWIGKYKHASKLKGKWLTDKGSSYTEPATAYEKKKKPILWHIMGHEGNEKAFTLVSEYVIDSKQFNSSSGWLSFDYPKSSLRKWLNGKFVKQSFSGVENKSLKTTKVVQGMYDSKKKKWVKGKFTTYKDKHTTNFPKIAKGDKVYLAWSVFGHEDDGDMGYDAYWDAGNITKGWKTAKKDIDGKILGSYQNVFDSGMGIYDDGVRVERVPPYRYALFKKEDWNEFKQGLNTMKKYLDSPMFKGEDPKFCAAYEAQYELNKTIYESSFKRSVSGSLRNGKSAGNSYEMSRAPVNYSSNHIGFGNYATSSFGIRPIIKLDPAKILSVSPKTIDGMKGLKLTLVSASVKLKSLYYSGNALKQGSELVAVSGGSVQLTGNGTGHDVLAYKVTLGAGSGCKVVASGKGSKTKLAVDTGVLDAGRYDLYVWAQNNQGSTSNEGSAPMHIKLTIA
jgi:hypothetical protein